MRVEHVSGMSEWFGAEVGLRQCCVMSPWLLNMYMDGVVREINSRVWRRGVGMIGYRINAWRVNQLMYTDDTLLIADSEENLN